MYHVPSSCSNRSINSKLSLGFTYRSFGRDAERFYLKAAQSKAEMITVYRYLDVLRLFPVLSRYHVTQNEKKNALDYWEQ